LSLFLSVEVQKEFPDWSAIVDETEVRVPRPSNYQKQKEYWSKKIMKKNKKFTQENNEKQ
jgi:hypothetical protein